MIHLKGFKTFENKLSENLFSELSQNLNDIFLELKDRRFILDIFNRDDAVGYDYDIIGIELHLKNHRTYNISEVSEYLLRTIEYMDINNFTLDGSPLLHTNKDGEYTEYPLSKINSNLKIEGVQLIFKYKF